MGNINNLIKVLNSHFNRPKSWGSISFAYEKIDSSHPLYSDGTRYRVKIKNIAVFNFDDDENLLCITSLEG
jgi:hypothetical protein